jgi:uncharacterized protein (DUF1778 family)
MARSTKVKRDRMLRSDASIQRKPERAAAYQQTGVTDFVVVNAMAAAERVVDAREKITLSPAEWDYLQRCADQSAGTEPEAQGGGTPLSRAIRRDPAAIEPLGRHHRLSLRRTGAGHLFQSGRRQM